jgi:peptide/nickel transport system permease protein
MFSYLLRRLFLLPFTLLAILFVNFIIINLAPGDPSLLSQISPTGDGTRQAGKEGELGREDQYLLFREHYGLTLPILWNSWPSTSREEVLSQLNALVTRRSSPEAIKEMGAKQYNELRISFGDRSRYLMSRLLAVAQDEAEPLAVREMAVRFFVRGGTRNGYLGRKLTSEQRIYNRKVAADNQLLRQLRWSPTDSDEVRGEKLSQLVTWYQANRDLYRYEPDGTQRLMTLFLETRLYRYFSRVLTLDFGSMRNDANRMVIAEVAKRFKVSLTIAVVPMLITFILCQIFGFLMALKQNRWPDMGLNILFLILYATPVFVVAPFLIEKIALHHTLPFTEIPVPTSGFHSQESDYLRMTSDQRLLDVAMHIFLPLIAVMYGSVAVQARLSRTAVLEVMRQDYVRTARAKGVPPFTVIWKHVGRNAAITIVTSLAASLGVILGGSLIVETIFGLDGFGRFFYEAILNRDYNVIMFSALASSLLALLGYLLADIAYTLLDPRITLERS